MGKRKFAAIIAMLMMLSPPLLASGQTSGGELVLRVAVQDDIKGLNPLTVSDVWSWNVLGYIFDGPITVNPETDELIPYIAVGSANISGKADSWDDCAVGNFGYSPKSGWENASKQETIIFYDFENVYWHDNIQMDIRDVMFSMHVAAQVPEWSSKMNPLKAANFTTTGWLEVYKVWESPDKLQAALRFQVQEPYANFFKDTLSTFLLPEHIWAYKVSGQNVDGARIWSDPDYNKTADSSWQVSAALSFINDPPIGSGPFKFEFWQKGQSIKINTWRGHFWDAGYKYADSALDDWGESLAHQPQIDAITYKIFKTAEAAVLALKADDIDYIAWSVPPTFIQELANEPGVELWQSPEPGFTCLAYNMRRSSFGYNGTGVDVGKPLRQAIAHCTDKNRIATRLLLGMGIPGNGPISTVSPLYNESMSSYPFDPEEAKRVLAYAGYKVKKQDGSIVSGDEAISIAGDGDWWVNPDGSNIGSSQDGKIKILFREMNYDPRNTHEALMIAQQMRAVGIYAEATAMDFTSLLQIIGNTQYTTPSERDFDMYVLSWRLGGDPLESLHDLFHSSQADNGYNYPGYSNGSFDSIIDAARGSEDQSVRTKAIMDAQAAICYDLPNDVLYFKTNIEAYRSDRFTGWVMGDTGSIFNRESIYNIRGRGVFKAIATFVSPPSAVVSNSTTPISIQVRDQDGNPLQGARITLSCTGGALSAETGLTNSAGKLAVDFTAPYADPGDPDAVANGTSVLISIVSATYMSLDGLIYDPAPSRQTPISVFPAGAEFISLKIQADPDVIDPDMSGGNPGFTFVDVLVTDKNGDPVQGAMVALQSNPASMAIEPGENATDAQGKARFTVISPDLPNDDDSVAQFTMTAIAVHSENANIRTENSIVLSIVDRYNWPPPPPPPKTYAGETFLAIIAVCLAAVALSAFMHRRRKP